MNEKDKLAKIEKLFVVYREHFDRAAEVLLEIHKLMNDEPGIASQMKQLEATWGLLWELRYKHRYIWTYTKDRPQLKRLLTSLTVPEVESRMALYLRSSDPFYTQARHPFGMFVMHVNRFAKAEGFALDAEAPADCAHRPRCTTDQQHTQRRAAELRES